jgi:hypothetical protein
MGDDAVFVCVAALMEELMLMVLRFELELECVGDPDRECLECVVDTVEDAEVDSVEVLEPVDVNAAVDDAELDGVNDDVTEKVSVSGAVVVLEAVGLEELEIRSVGEGDRLVDMVAVREGVHDSLDEAVEDSVADGDVEKECV